jgi:hypothetical protein
MKNSKYILVVIIFVLAVFLLVSKKKADTVPTPAPEKITVKEEIKDTKQPIELCFAKFGVPDKNGFYDQYTLRLNLSGEKVKGELNLLPRDKDRKTGEIEGTVGKVDPKMMARQADLWWFTSTEGMSVKEELRIIFGEGTAEIGFGEMMDRGDGVYVYKDTTKLNYSLQLTDVACTDFTERVNVEDYL